MRKARTYRKTKETEIEIELNLDGTGKYKILTGMKFFSHMLEIFAKQGLFDLTIKCKGDLRHHAIEDLGIVMGRTFKEAFGTKKEIKRYGQRILPMDETLCLCAVDVCGRGYFAMAADIKTEDIYDFFYSFAINAEINLHFKMFNGENEHHKLEAMFKSFGKAMREACEIDERCKGIPSTKGTL